MFSNTLFNFVFSYAGCLRPLYTWPHHETFILHCNNWVCVWLVCNINPKSISSEVLTGIVYSFQPDIHCCSNCTVCSRWYDVRSFFSFFLVSGLFANLWYQVNAYSTLSRNDQCASLSQENEIFFLIATYSSTSFYLPIVKKNWLEWKTLIYFMNALR